MRLVVRRSIFSTASTIGTLYVDNSPECYTLEPVTRTDGKPRAIPEGTYPLTRRYSPKHGRDVPHVENVPGFSEIEIHPGNYPKDTEGCCLVGRRKGTDFVGDSRLAFEALWSTLSGAWARGEHITITYERAA